MQTLFWSILNISAIKIDPHNFELYRFNLYAFLRHRRITITTYQHKSYVYGCGGNMSVGLDQRSCSTSGRVITWMGDCLLAHKPSQYSLTT